MNSGDDYKHSQDESVGSDSKDNPGKSRNDGSDKPKDVNPDPEKVDSNDKGKQEPLIPGQEVPKDVKGLLVAMGIPEDLDPRVMLHPIRGGGTTTDGFGPRINPVSGNVSDHKGLDLAAQEGTNVLAVLGGTVESAVENDRIYGNYVLLKHENALTTFYAHLYKKPNVNKGDEVPRGTILGGVGKTGQSTGNHLHFEMRKNGNAMNPDDSGLWTGRFIVD